MKRLALLSDAISNPPLSLQNLQTLRIQTDNGVGTIWFNKEASLNSISFRMVKQFRLILEHLDSNPKVKIILIKSKHPKAFCVGADLKSIFFDEDAKKQSSIMLMLERTFSCTRKPVVSVVDGMALGGGLEIALLTDIILCSEKAVFGLPEIKLGIFPGGGGTQHLPRITGMKVAMRRILTGQPMNASLANDLNIAVCLPNPDFDGKVKDFVDNLLNKPSEALFAAKEAIKASLQTTLQQGLKYEASLFQSLFNKSSAKQGLSAFVEKRKPNFRNM